MKAEFSFNESVAKLSPSRNVLGRVRLVISAAMYGEPGRIGVTKVVLMEVNMRAVLLGYFAFGPTPLMILNVSLSLITTTQY